MNELVTLLLLVAIVGLVAWALVTFVPMPEPFKRGIVALSAVAVLVYVLQYFGLVDWPRRR